MAFWISSMLVMVFWFSMTDVSGASSEDMISSNLNVSQAARKGLGVFCSPIPMTNIPASLRRWASLVKSESLETRQKPSTLPE